MVEIWKDILGHEGFYQVSNLGNVKSLHYRNGNDSNNLKLYVNPNGYVVVDLRCKIKRVHRLVAIAFIPNPNNKPEVNHKKGIKADNRASELEWVTKSENHLHAYGTGIKKGSMCGRFGDKHHTSKAVIQSTLSGDYVNEYGSCREASRHTGASQPSISKVCNNKAYHAGGFVWKFK